MYIIGLFTDAGLRGSSLSTTPASASAWLTSFVPWYGVRTKTGSGFGGLAAATWGACAAAATICWIGGCSTVCVPLFAMLFSFCVITHAPVPIVVWTVGASAYVATFVLSMIRSPPPCTNRIFFGFLLLYPMIRLKSSP